MTIVQAQRDMVRAYVGGGPGVFVSSLVWLVAAFVAGRGGVAPAFATLFFGGMLIFPLSKLIAVFGFRRGREARDNPLGRVALESTIAMIGGLFVAWLVLPLRADYVFPFAAVAVGTHYAVFRTIYGDRLFWLLAALLTALGVIGALHPTILPTGIILAVGLVELAFAVLLTVRAVRAGTS